MDSVKRVIHACLVFEKVTKSLNIRDEWLERRSRSVKELIDEVRAKNLLGLDENYFLGLLFSRIDKMEPVKRGSFIKCAKWLSEYFNGQEASDEEEYFTDFSLDSDTSSEESSLCSVSDESSDEDTLSCVSSD